MTVTAVAAGEPADRHRLPARARHVPGLRRALALYMAGDGLGFFRFQIAMGRLPGDGRDEITAAAALALAEGERLRAARLWHIDPVACARAAREPAPMLSAVHALPCPHGFGVYASPLRVAGSAVAAIAWGPAAGARRGGPTLLTTYRWPTLPAAEGEPPLLPEHTWALPGPGHHPGAARVLLAPFQAVRTGAATVEPARIPRQQRRADAADGISCSELRRIAG